MVKFFVVIVLMSLAYLGFSKFMDTSLLVGEKISKKFDIEDVEKATTVTGLMMYLGNPPVMKEHLLMHSHEDCLIRKEIAELTSGAIYKCLKVDAVVKNKKIVSIIKEIEVIKWNQHY